MGGCQERVLGIFEDTGGRARAGIALDMAQGRGIGAALMTAKLDGLLDTCGGGTVYSGVVDDCFYSGSGSRFLGVEARWDFPLTG